MTLYHLRIGLFLLAFGLPARGWSQPWTFVDVTSQAGVAYNHGYTSPAPLSAQALAGGVAAGDYDQDGWIDLYLVRGDIGPNVLLRNRGDGTFEEVGAAAGVGLTGTRGCGPFFTDLDGDGWLDLFIGGIDGTNLSLFRNRGDGTFEDVTATSGITTRLDTFSAAAGDYDRDGDLDLFLTHWGSGIICSRLWKNSGNGTFSCADGQAGVSGNFVDFSFTPNFADINNDRWPDILLASDYEQTQVFLNDRDGTFTDVTAPIITDENGMGGTVGDYDNDGDLDWFVSSIWQEGGSGSGWGSTGNRLYRNRGDGSFEDATDEAGVRVGHWGWGASFADFNNDGHLDLFHVNGWPDTSEAFVDDPARLFISNGDGTFTERSADLGAAHLGQGRGIVCFDYDRDGDIDIFVASAGEPSLLLRNDGGNALNYLTVRLLGENPNAEAVGARIYVTVGGEKQMRELRAGCNFESQDPVEAHFGLGTATTIDTVRVEWPDTAVTVLTSVSANQLLTVDYHQPPPGPTWDFVDVTLAAGVAYNHGYVSPVAVAAEAVAGGVAAGDYDKDSWIDLYLVRGNIGSNVLLRNRRDGTFEDVGAAAGVGLTGTKGSGPLFADLNGDGWLDLFVGGIEGTGSRLFFSRRDGTFEDVTAASGIDTQADTYSAAAGDYDRDGDLDLFLAHWDQVITCGRLWKNDGNGTFSCVDAESGVGAPVAELSFTPNFADINNDRWPDVLLAADFEQSQVFLNNRDGTFSDMTAPVITDENGMGGAVGDYDNDGDLDWFVSSIWQGGGMGYGWGITGNRLYRNLGDGSFEDATDEAGVRVGHWGWAASFADFNNDGHLDLYHVNGWPFDVTTFLSDPAPLFISNGDGTFAERSAELGATHLGQGRGIVCFDYDRDGDIDIFVASALEQSLLLRNDGGNALNYLTVRLRGKNPNAEAVGARIYVTVGGERQMRELRAGCNFESQDPVEAHFGLGTATMVDTVRVEWPDTAVTVRTSVSANQLLIVDYPKPAPPPPTPPPVNYTLRIVGVGPNPFAAETTIDIEVPAATTGSIRVYDVKGRLVRTLAIASSNGGAVAATWNGRDTAGNRVASGVYLVRIETPSGTSESKRIVVLR